MEVKRAILLGMMTEGGVETIKVTRLNEHDNSEMQDCANTTEAFQKTCAVLFEHRRAQHIGVTKYMVDALKKDVVFTFPQWEDQDIVVQRWLGWNSGLVLRLDAAMDTAVVQDSPGRESSFCVGECHWSSAELEKELARH